MLARRDVELSPYHACGPAVFVALEDLSQVEDPHPLAAFGRDAILTRELWLNAFEAFRHCLQNGGPVVRVYAGVTRVYVGPDLFGTKSAHFSPTRIEDDFIGCHVPIPSREVGTL